MGALRLQWPDGTGWHNSGQASPVERAVSSASPPWLDSPHRPVRWWLAAGARRAGPTIV